MSKRQEIIWEIVRLLKQEKRFAPDKMEHELVEEAELLEPDLYRSAPSFGAYCDKSTLSHRLQHLGEWRSNRDMSEHSEMMRDIARLLEEAEKKDEVPAKLCSGCGKKSDALKMCHGCQCVWYCDKECQNKHREEHEKECRRIKAVLDERGGKLYLGTEEEIGQLEKLPPREECDICRHVMPIYDKLHMYFECCGNTVCQGCLGRHICATKELNLKRSRDLEKEVPPLPNVCPFCRTALERSDKEICRILAKESSSRTQKLC